MPSYKTHLIAGIIFFIATAYLLKFEFNSNLFIGFFLALLGGLFPDLDSQSSKINNLAEALFALIIVGIFAYAIISGTNSFFYYGLIFAGLLFVVQFLRHRGRLHSLWLGEIVSIGLGYFNLVYGIGFFAGFISHIILDKVF